MGQALYRKYRSKKLSEVIGQEHITLTLTHALESGQISHAYLFTGPRGVGKTSVARILAHEINAIPYTDDATHIDIIEIDAASNRRIDEIRELRDKVYVAPTSAKYKVYIIDEVHMLTREAFNALLKTLEEPPAHVVFILATTETHKLPATIISRTQRYTFRPVERSKVVAHLKTIAKAEKISISEAALELLADHGEGSFRDSISLLDQASGNRKPIELVDVQTLLGLPPRDATTQLLDAVMNGSSVQQIAFQLGTLQDQGFQANAVAKELAKELRREIIGQAPRWSSNKSLNLLAQLIEVPAAHDPEKFLEIVLLGAAQTENEPNNLATTEVEPVPKQPADRSAAKTLPAEKEDKKLTTSVEKSSPTTTQTQPLDMTIWPQVLEALKQKYNTLYGVVRMAQPSFQANELQLSFAFAFHQKRINDEKNRKLIADIIEQLTGEKCRIVCLLDKTITAAMPSKTAAQKAEGKADSASISTISSIFGGGEILEI